MQKWSYSRLTHYISMRIINSAPVMETRLTYQIYGDLESHREFNPDKLGDLVAELGDDGWELINVTQLESHDLDPRSKSKLTMIDYYFKKPKVG